MTHGSGPCLLPQELALSPFLPRSRGAAVWPCLSPNCTPLTPGSCHVLAGELEGGVDGDSLINENRCVCRAASSVCTCSSPCVSSRLGTRLSGPLAPCAPREAGSPGRALLAHSLCWVTPEVEDLLAAVAVPAGPCLEGPGPEAGGVLPGVWAGSAPGPAEPQPAQLGTVSGQNKPLALASAAVASGPLLCRPQEAAEPAPSGILDAAFCIAAVPEVGGGRLCRSWRAVAEGSRALGRGAVGCHLQGSRGRAGVRQQEST